VTVIASGQHSPQAIASDGKFVYWVDADSVVGAVVKAPVGGGAARYIATNLSTADTEQIALDSAKLYVPVDGSILALPSDPASPIVGASSSYVVADGKTNAVASDGKSLYWAQATPSVKSSISVVTASLAGGAATTLGTASSPAWRNYLAVDTANVYVTPGAALIAEVGVNGGATTTMPIRAECLAIDATHIYFTDAGAGTVNKMPLHGGPIMVLADEQLGPWRIAVDGAAVYWGADQNGGSLMKVAKSGGAATTLATGYGEPRAIAVDGASVYWADPASGRVLRVAK
jgi:hypothetical protein